MSQTHLAVDIREVTFMLTDIESSTRLWEAAPDAMRVAMVRHDRALAEVVATHGGEVVKPRGEGDSGFVVFDRAGDAVRCAASLQRRFGSEPWPPLTPIRVRIAVHCGAADWREGDYYGDVVNRCARLRAAAHGGQVVITQAALDQGGYAIADPLGTVPLGEHHLKDLTRPERVWQLTHPDLERDFPPLRSAAKGRHSLPTELTSFVGRATELAGVIGELRTVRVLTLTGPGGVGKTRLALRAAASLLDDLPDGVWFVDLAGVLSGADVLPAIATTLGLRPEGPEPLADLLRDGLKDRSLLVVVDNCEHLLTAAAAAVSLLTAAGPGVRVLATSREPLHVEGERISPVDPLPVVEEPQPNGRLADAVTLFCDRMRIHGAAVPRDDGSLATIAEICRRLDGIPLAIEFAAARARALAPADLLARLQRPLPELGGGRHWHGTDRQRTLESTIDWSYRLLEAEERSIFDRLGVFEGGFTLDAAAAVCSDVLDDIACVDAVSSLVEKSLVVTQERGGAMRYRLLESTGDFAMQRLVESGEAERARLRHAEYMTRLGIESSAALGTPAEPSALRRVAAEWRNIVAALTWCLAGEGPAEQGARLAAGLGRVWTRVPSFSEGMRWLELAWDAATQDMAQERLGILIARADVAFSPGDMRGAVWIKEALGIAEALEDRALMPWLLYAQGLWANMLGDPVSARDALRRSATIASANRDELGLARAAGGLGRIAYLANELDEAEAQLRQALSAFRRIGNPYSAALAGFFLALALALRGDHAAESLLDEALALSVASGTSNLSFDGLTARALVDVHLDRRPQAQRSLCEAITEAEAQGRPDVIGELLQNAALLAARCRAWRRCACLTGAREAYGTSPEVQVQIAAMAVEAAERARAALGDAAFETAADQGRRMELSELITLIATELDEPPSQAPLSR